MMTKTRFSDPKATGSSQSVTKNPVHTVVFSGTRPFVARSLSPFLSFTPFRTHSLSLFFFFFVFYSATHCNNVN